MNPEVLRDVFNKHAIYQKPKSTPLTKLLAQGIVSYEEDKWTKHKKILNPAFHMEKIKDMPSAVHLSCTEMVSQWVEAVTMKGSSCELDIWPTFKYWLVMHLDWQARTREEVLQVFGDGMPEFDGLNRLKIVTMILNEPLRLYPTVGGLGRRITTKTKLGELILPAGVMLALPTILVHHDK
ncbi:Cytochrome [Capsicum chinense]|nr:Cytochrome [Capsicum chinense]